MSQLAEGSEGILQKFEKRIENLWLCNQSNSVQCLSTFANIFINENIEKFHF